MKMKLFPPFKEEGEASASWGEARLIKHLDEKTELRGGSEQDRAEARGWISMFLNDAVVWEVQTLKGGQTTYALSNTTVVYCLNAGFHPAAMCSTMRGVWRATMLKSAMQKAVEAQAQ